MNVKPQCTRGEMDPTRRSGQFVRMTQKQGHYIYEWRKHRGLTLEKLAAAIDSTHATVSRIERGKMPYNQGMLERLAKALDTDPASLIMRNPSDPDGMWSIHDQLTPDQKVQGVALLKALKASSR